MAALDQEARITTRLGGEGETVTYRITADGPAPGHHIFHLSTPVRHWWDNVVHACATFQPFAHEDAVDPWCERHHLPRGAVMSLPDLWDFAQDWYGDYVKAPWRKRSGEDVRALFAKHGLTGSFWQI